MTERLYVIVSGPLIRGTMVLASLDTMRLVYKRPRVQTDDEDRPFSAFVGATKWSCLSRDCSGP